MPNQERMTIEERFKYFRTQRGRYEQADHKGKGRLLDEMEAVTGLHRKSIIRRMKEEPQRQERSQQRGPTYGPEVRMAVLVTAESLDWVCAERLTPSLRWLPRLLVEQGELDCDEAVLAQLETISVSSVRRILSTRPPDPWQLPRKRPSANPVARQVPIARIAWDVTEAGHVEVDLVHHSGRSSEGQYLHTLQLVDVASGWSEREVVAGRSYVVMEAAFTRILERLPFNLLQVHCDNGPEFLNHHLLHFWGQRPNPPLLSRSRPYRKNDNPFVEQKNSSLVRAYTGYQRFDCPTHALALAGAYRLMGPYYNLFQPVMRLAEKAYIEEPNRRPRILRRYDQATTPLDRLRMLGALIPEREEQLLALRRAINPRQLRQSIYESLERLRHLPPGIGLGDVRQVMSAIADLPPFTPNP